MIPHLPLAAQIAGVDATTFVFAVVIILVALAFDYTNGFHDAANSIATVVSTRVLSPRIAVAMAAACNFVAYFVVKYIFHTQAVAKTVGSGMVDIGGVLESWRLWVLLCGVLGAI